MQRLVYTASALSKIGLQLQEKLLDERAMSYIIAAVMMFGAPRSAHSRPGVAFVLCVGSVL